MITDCDMGAALRTCSILGAEAFSTSSEGATQMYPAEREVGRLQAENAKLRVTLEAVRDRLEQCFEPTVPLMTISSELDGAVKDAYLIIRRATV